ncbi:hypothetical protein EKE94_00640 [Mesobaculum littorinae]|uniref:Uncharacterized protein n=1 Tax=Mesobaculum littorinae TaxID=2486419 RepID=A0A438AKP9_9RHOB|nr:hypothetical protein [Mesobaculum littorinae]RVV99239.1 hypothetical protein EKE94_00640 [Mesobaculum littorinae]
MAEASLPLDRLLNGMAGELSQLTDLARDVEHVVAEAVAGRANMSDLRRDLQALDLMTQSLEALAGVARRCTALPSVAGMTVPGAAVLAPVTLADMRTRLAGDEATQGMEAGEVDHF